LGYAYTQSGKHFYKNAVNERVKLGENIRWEGNLVFGNRAKTEAAELYTANQLDMSLPFVYYENAGTTNEAYLCIRDDSIELSEFTYNGVSGNTVNIKEAYMLNND